MGDLDPSFQVGRLYYGPLDGVVDRLDSDATFHVETNDDVHFELTPDLVPDGHPEVAISYEYFGPLPGAVYLFAIP